MSPPLPELKRQKPHHGDIAQKDRGACYGRVPHQMRNLKR